jgi:DNA-binding PadR family transcriptional regulator
VERPVRPSPLALAVLSLLSGGPLHPYAVQRLLKDWGKDQVVNVGERASLYKVIRRLDESGLVRVRQVERDQQYPERTVYEITDLGRATALEWLTGMLASPKREFPQFPAALSFVMLLEPAVARDALQRRVAEKRAELAALDAELAEMGTTLPRVTLIETEFLRATTAAELAWMEAIVDELASGALTWTYEDLADAAGAAYQLE